MIKRRREELGLESRELAKRVGVSPSYITHIENNNKLPSLKVIQKIADCLGISKTRMEGVGLTLVERYFIDKGEDDEVVEHLNETVSTLRLEVVKLKKQLKKKQ